MQSDKKNNVNYLEITETPDTKGSQEQINRLYTRYKFAAKFCTDKEILEVACGAGQGLGYLAKSAKRIVGGDIEENNLKFARQNYQNRKNIEIRLLDAQQLPFEDKSFDVVILYEAIYYLKEPDNFIREAKRVLRKGGVLIIGSANKEWNGFNPSPYSRAYFSAAELSEILKKNGFPDVDLFADSPIEEKTVKDKIISLIKKLAVKFHLIPKTMKGKELFKRIFMGKLVPLPYVIEDNMAEYTPPVPISINAPVTGYKVLYAIARV